MKKIWSKLITILTLLLLVVACIWYMPPLRAALHLGPQQSAEGPFGEPVMRVHFIDVGQADATLIEADGHFMMIDGGDEDHADSVVTYLHNQGVEKLDYAIGTHPHSDHIGGLDNVLVNFPTAKMILSPATYNTWSYTHLCDIIKNRQIPVEYPAPGTTYPLGNAVIAVIGPAGQYEEDMINNWSVAVRIDYNDTSFVFTGDAQQEAEEDMCNGKVPLKADVLKLGHHGSGTSTTWDFLDEVDPTAVVISCALGNDYEYPHHITMAKVEDMDVYRTDLQGTIVAESDGTQIRWNVSPWTKESEGEETEDEESEDGEKEETENEPET